MPCNSSEGMGDAYRTDPKAQNKIADLQKIVDDQADSLCFLREIVYRLLCKQDMPHDLFQRLADRVMKHREFDKKEGRIHE